MEANNWRTQLAQEIRRNVINRLIAVIMKGLSLSPSRQPIIHHFEKLAFSFEEEIFKEATSKEDYMRKIHLRVQSIQTKCQQKIANSLQSDPSCTCESLSDKTPSCFQPKMQEQGQNISYPLASQTASAGVLSSSNSTMTMTPATGSSQIPMLHFADQNPNSQIASGNSRNSEGSLVVQRQMQGRHHLLQSHRSHQYPCKHQLQHEVLKQQSLLSHTPPQYSRESVMQSSSAMQPSVVQTDSPSGLLQNQQSSTQWPTQSLIHQQRAPMLLQPKMPSQQQQDTLQRQNISDSMLQGQNAIEHPKQCGQLQSGFPAMSSMTLDSASKTRDESKGDWVEELFQRLKTMKEMYLPDLEELFKKVAVRLEPGDSLPPRLKTKDQSELERLDSSIRRAIKFLNLPKCELTLDHNGKMGQLEKRIMNIVDINRRLGPISSMGQRHLSSLDLQSLQPQPQKPRVPIHRNQINLIASEDDSQFSSEVTSSQKGIINSPPPVTHLVKGQGSALSSSLHSPSITFQCATLLSQSGGNVPHQSINPHNSNSSVLQDIHLKQQIEHQIVKAQQGRQQFQQHQEMQQSMQQRELLAQQQPTNLQLQALKMPSLRQMNEINRVKMGHGMGIKAGILLQHHSIEQRPVNKLQAVKSEPPSPVSSYQSQHSTPLMGQENLRMSLTKDGNSLQYRNPHPNVPSPSSPSIISPIKGNHEKLNSGNSSLSNTESIGHQQTTVAVAQDTPFIISSPGLSISPLLAESINLDNISTMDFCEASLNEKPLQRLISVVRSMSHKALSASVGDIEAVVRMVERTAGSLPGNGCRSATGEDLAAMTNCHLQGRNATNLYEITGTKNMKRYVSAIPSNVASSAGSVNYSLKRLRDSDTLDLESTGTSRTNRPKIEAICSLVKEIWEINHQLIHTVIDVSHEGVNPTGVSSVVTEAGEGTIVICSSSAVAFSPNSNLQLQHSSAQMPPTLSLRLLVPTNYPTFSPILIDESPKEFSTDFTEYEHLSVKAKSKLHVSLRCFKQPISLGKIAKTWDACAYSVISEYAHQNGGGNFSSRYGTWENCLTVT